DIFMVSLQGDAYHLFRNNVGQEGHFLRLELEGTDSGRDAFGAVVRVKTSAGVLTKVKAGGSGYLAESDPRLLFGLGDDAEAEWLEVTWPSGRVQRLDEVAADSSLRLVEGQAGFAAVDERRFQLADPLGPQEMLLTKLNLEIGQSFPDLRLQAADGSSTSIRKIQKPGRRTLLNLWATYCIPCKKEMPELEDLRARFGEAGIDLVGISLDVDNNELVPPFLASLGINYPAYVIDDPRLPDLYAGGLVFIPMSVLLDPDGRVAEVFGSWSPETSRAFQRLLSEPTQ
ncbi:MAG: ASPIC/UnbV domain-containing protein, partial [Acidobacteriota bacterium]